MTISFDLTTALSVALVLFVLVQKSSRNRWAGRLITLLLLSPGLRYLSALFTFPIRLKLSAWAGLLLRAAGLNVETVGNAIIRQTATGSVEMAVDPACMGLQMTGVSLLVALFFLIWQEQQTQRAVPAPWIIGYSLTAFGITILSNLFRILLLVVFGAMPGTVSHELIGLVCLAAYTWLPTWFLAKALVYRFSQPVGVSATTLWQRAWGVGVLTIGCVTMFLAARPADQRRLHPADHLNPAGYAPKQLTEGIIQLAKPGVLVYLKPQTDWFSVGHSPVACWTGSGYELRQVRETRINGVPVYVGQLRQPARAGQTHERNVLYTAWWFSNGSSITTSQFAMRSDMVRNNAAYVLVNVTATSQASLIDQLEYVLASVKKPRVSA
ncbi:exosortase N [Spirosoma pomorum]